MGFELILGVVGAILPGEAADPSAKNSETRRRRVKDHPTRKQILELLTDRPGRSISELCRAIGAGWGTVQHHLYLLAKTGMIRSVMQGRNHRFFNGKDAAKHLSDVALLMRGRVRQVANAVVEEPGVGQRKLTESIGMSRKVFRQYANLLLQQGLMMEERRSKFRFYYPTGALRELLASPEEQHLPTSARDVPLPAPASVPPTGAFTPTLHAQPMPGSPPARIGKPKDGQT